MIIIIINTTIIGNNKTVNSVWYQCKLNVIMGSVLEEP